MRQYTFSLESVNANGRKETEYLVWGFEVRAFHFDDLPANSISVPRLDQELGNGFMNFNVNPRVHQKAKR